MLDRNPPNQSPQIIHPFLKWAGGKRWLVLKHSELFPNKFDRYIEPFVGSGAVYFYLKPKKAILADINKELIESYRAIKNDWQAVWKELKTYQKKHSSEFYYITRSKEYDDLFKKAARFIYLNRTCWNGLYRVNKRGVFNVPIGTKTSVVLDTDDFFEVSKLLKGAKLFVSDFEKIIDKAEKGDFLFIDPPYTVKHNLNGFIKYNDKLFSWEDQIVLRDLVQDARKRGVKILLTNANHESIKKLYRGFGQCFSIERPSVISGKVSGRGCFNELIVKV